MFYFMNVVRSFVNYAIFRELCDRMRFEVDCVKSHHRILSEGLYRVYLVNSYLIETVREYFVSTRCHKGPCGITAYNIIILLTPRLQVVSLVS